jgi:hypothetical protein
MGITIVTILTFALLNSNVWDAIFNVPKLKARISSIEAQVNELKSSRILLEKEAEDLEKINKNLTSQMSESRKKMDILTSEKISLEKENAKKVSLISENQLELEKLKADSSKLRLEIIDLEDELKRKSEGKVVFLKDTPILTAVLKPMPSWEGLLAQIRQVLFETREEAVKRGAVARDFDDFWKDNEQSFIRIAKQYHIQNIELAFGLVAALNVYKGDKLEISIKAAPNKLIAKTGDFLLPKNINTIFSGDKKDESVYERQLIYLYRRACSELYKKGRVQAMPELKPQSLVSAVNNLLESTGECKVDIEVKEDIYTAGSGKIDFKILDISEYMQEIKQELMLDNKEENNREYMERD